MQRDKVSIPAGNVGDDGHSRADVRQRCKGDAITSRDGTRIIGHGNIIGSCLRERARAALEKREGIT